MYICVDFDGVLADTAVVKRQWVASATGRRIVAAAFDRSTIEPLIGEEAYLAMQAEVGYADTLLAPPMVDAVRVLRKLSGVARIAVVSARPPEKMIWLDRWLYHYGLKETIWCSASSYGCSKSDIARQLGAGWLVDDDRRHASGLPDDTKFVLFGSREEDADEGVLVARDWECVETMVLASQKTGSESVPPTEAPGFF